MTHDTRARWLMTGLVIGYVLAGIVALAWNASVAL